MDVSTHSEYSIHPTLVFHSRSLQPLSFTARRVGPTSPQIVESLNRSSISNEARDESLAKSPPLTRAAQRRLRIRRTPERKETRKKSSRRAQHPETRMDTWNVEVGGQERGKRPARGKSIGEGSWNRRAGEKGPLFLFPASALRRPAFTWPPSADRVE